MDTLKFVLRSALWWILCCGIAFLSVYLQIHFSTPTGEYGTGLLPSELCDVNWVLWAIGMVLGLGGFAAVWHFLLKKELLRAADDKRTLLFWISLALLGCIGILFSCIGGLICALPFMKQSASPDWVNYYAFWYPPLIAVAVFVLGILTVRNAKNAPLPES